MIYEDALRVVEQLTPEDKHRLLKALTAQQETVPDELRQLRKQVAQRARTTPDERRAALAALDHAAAKIGAAWRSEKSAAEAVAEQRRDL